MRRVGSRPGNRMGDGGPHGPRLAAVHQPGDPHGHDGDHDGEQHQRPSSHPTIVTGPAPSPQKLSTGSQPPRRALSRRGLLLAGAAGAVAAGTAGIAVDDGMLPGRARLRRALGQTGPAGHIPDVAPGHVVSGTFVSRHRLGAETGWSVIYPGRRPERLPVAVALHGLGGTHRTWIDELGVDRFLAAAVEAGVAPFAIATVDGGTTYWHRRPNGEDAGAMVIDEFLPLLRARGLDTSRIAFHGYSMGGYGSLHLAPIVGRPAVRAVAVMSAAIWQGATTFSPSGFSSSAEYRRYTVFGRQSQLDGMPVRLDCGTEDPFCPADRAYVAGFDRPVASSFQDGGHDAAYWTRMLPRQLTFVGHHLAPR
jgi:predicted esterase